ncbi:MAG: hypothetical protein ACTMUB_05420 [cyanobacterium endosymbiont of Rhopalodia musculus]|nr:hypothetical protein [cyanobacterium endosymbiont of Epithemia clementina EcSB]WGT67587.1 hypothetical protein P3F56_00280 [cyanobacterium endosymbiont of Epithemia clementina EcSB]
MVPFAEFFNIAFLVNLEAIHHLAGVTLSTVFLTIFTVPWDLFVREQ